MSNSVLWGTRDLVRLGIRSSDITRLIQSGHLPPPAIGEIGSSRKRKWIAADVKRRLGLAEQAAE